jgi:hypothetical protein
VALMLQWDRTAKKRMPAAERHGEDITIRQHVAAMGRRVATLCKREEGLRQQLALYHVYYNFCLPHAGLRQPLPQPEPTKGNGSPKQ